MGVIEVVRGEMVEASARWRHMPVRNTLEDVVGEVRPAFDLVWT